MKIFLQGKNKYQYSTKDILGNRTNSKFSYVYKGVNIDTGEAVTIKKLNPLHYDNEKLIKKFKKESSYNFEHKNLQKSIDYIESEKGYFVVNEYVEGVDLLTFVKRNKKQFFKDYSYFKIIFIQVLKALKHIHSLNFIHADVKPANIIVNNTNKEINVKLIDYGQVIDLDDIVYYKEMPFSLMYSPPEFILKAYELYNNTSDFYSVGVSMYHALTSRLPFDNYCNPLKLISLQLNYKIKPHERIAPDIFKIISKATEKYIFPKPHIYYPKYKVISMLKKGQAKRYQTAEEFISAIYNLY